MKYYERIRDLREDSDNKQTYIANLIDVSEAQYRRYEQGKNVIPIDKAITLANFYDVSLDYLAGQSNDKGGNHCNFLDSREKELIQNWRKISVKQQNRILDEIEDYLEEPPRTTARKSVI